MPLRHKSDYARGDETARYCSHCTNPDGSLKSYEEVLEATKGYFIRSQGVDPLAAHRMAEKLLKAQPAWR